MRHVLILTAGYGEGHNAAARGLHAAFAGHPAATARVWDPLADCFGKVYDWSRRNYLKTIEKRPRHWLFIYRLLDKTPLIALAEWPLFHVRRHLRRTLAGESPHAIVSVYPLYPYLLDRLYPAGQPRPFKVYTVVTDSITINSVWHRCTSDLFLVPNEETAEVMRAAGVPAEKLRVLGFPVPPIFATPPAIRPLPGDGPARVLFMINAGRTQALEVVKRLLKLDGIALTVTAGRDEELGTAIRELARTAGRDVQVLGWVSNMPELVMSHHVLIGKAGGASVQEAIAARTPMIITKVVPGQEEGNARLLEQNGCGAVRETPEAIASQVEALFAGGAALWKEWEANISRLSRPDAALRMAELILADC